MKKIAVLLLTLAIGLCAAQITNNTEKSVVIISGLSKEYTIQYMKLSPGIHIMFGKKKMSVVIR